MTIYIDLTVDVDGSLFPIDGVDQIKAALKNLGDAQQIGEDVIALRYECVALTIAGVVDVSDFNIGTAPSPSGDANITIALRELARFDTSNFAVTVNTL